MTPEEAIKTITQMLNEFCNEDSYAPECEDAVDMAISALEKQMPEKPMKSIDVYNENLYKLNCPTCGKYIAYGNSRVGTLNKWTMAPDRCGYCGQAVDFSEWEEGEA